MKIIAMQFAFIFTHSGRSAGSFSIRPEFLFKKGSFSDNELSPECLLGAQHLIKVSRSKQQTGYLGLTGFILLVLSFFIF